MKYFWKINDGSIYSAADAAFVDFAPEDEIVVLYSDTLSAGKATVADKAFLRKTVLFYGYPLGDALKSRLDKIRDIQAEYAPMFTELQEAKVGAEMRDDAEDVTAIKAEYVALLQKMNQKIQAVPNG